MPADSAVVPDELSFCFRVVTPLTLFAFYAAVIGHEEKIKKKKKKRHHKLLGEVQCKGDYHLKSSEQIQPLETSQWPLLLKVADPLLFVI
jgi:hypothetical protein